MPRGSVAHHAVCVLRVAPLFADENPCFFCQVGPRQHTGACIFRLFGSITGLGPPRCHRMNCRGGRRCSVFSLRLSYGQLAPRYVSVTFARTGRRTHTNQARAKCDQSSPACWSEPRPTAVTPPRLHDAPHTPLPPLGTPDRRSASNPVLTPNRRTGPTPDCDELLITLFFWPHFPLRSSRASPPFLRAHHVIAFFSLTITRMKFPAARHACGPALFLSRFFFGGLIPSSPLGPRPHARLAASCPARISWFTCHKRIDVSGEKPPHLAVLDRAVWPEHPGRPP